MELATAIALVGLAKTLVDTTKGLKDLIGSRRPLIGPDRAKEGVEKVGENLAAFYKQLGTLTDQLEKTEYLMRMAEAWRQVLDRMSFPVNIDAVSDDEARRLRKDLGNFLYDSAKDYFTDAFFHTSFEQVPPIHQQLQFFRQYLTQAEPAVNSIPPENTSAFRSQWQVILTHINNLRNSGANVSKAASDVHGALIKALKDVADQT